MLLTQPELYPDLLPAWRAFEDLHFTRDTGFQESRIRHSEIESWGRIHGYSGEHLDDLAHGVRALDEARFAFLKRRKSEAPK